MNNKYTWKEKEHDEWVQGVYDTVEECIEDAKYKGVKGKIQIAKLYKKFKDIGVYNIRVTHEEVFLDYYF